jgi:diguanylate cyclase
MKRSYRIIMYLLMVIVSTIIMNSVTLHINEDRDPLVATYMWLRIVLTVICLLVVLNLDLKRLNLGLWFIIMGYIFEYVNRFVISSDLEQSIIFLLIFMINAIGLLLTIYGVIGEQQHRNKMQKKLHHLAYFDSLTELPNYNNLRSSQDFDKFSGLEYSDKHMKYDKAAIIFLDIDDFKHINDYISHEGGDLILAIVANKLKQYFTSEDFICRIAGDEFVIICNHASYLAQLEQMLKHLIKYIDEPMQVLEKEIAITVSLGIALYPDHGDDIDSLLKKADLAMFQAKRNGKNKSFVFYEALEGEFHKRLDLLYDLKHAIKQKNFILYYQSKVNMNQETTGFEALIRWKHPIKGFISPDQFIPIAEEFGLIAKIDHIVLNMAIKQLARWKMSGMKLYPISVNVSPQYFLSPQFISNLEQLISEYEIDPTYLTIEITENVAMNDIVTAQKTIQELQKRRIKLAIDDFGKGYSSINYIKELEFDYLKIDKAYIDHIVTNSKDQALIEFIIQLSRAFHFKVVSEGVETMEQWQLLRRLGCHESQGYLFSKPLPIEALNLDK